MSKHDVIVIGAGMSGLAFAHHAARAGRSVLVLEREKRVGGCVHTHRTGPGYWFELGAHTCYNSYLALTEILEELGMRDKVLRREGSRLRFLRDDRLVKGSNLSALMRLFSWGELLPRLPRLLTEQKDGKTVYGYYSRIVGRRNYGEVLGPMLSAVPSQSADAFPAGMLFKSRGSRRKSYPRSFTLEGGLGSLPLALARGPRVEVLLGRAATGIGRTRDGFFIESEAARHEAGVVALATPPGAAAQLLRQVAPELASRVARVKETRVESLGFAVRAEAVHLPVSMFLIPRDDLFYSVVTRDSVPDKGFRGFAVHFKPGLSREARLERAARILALEPRRLEDVTERVSVLPSPVLGHENLVREIDRLLAKERLCATGNWFSGLSIEDCLQRSRAEWERVAALDAKLAS
ncbi:MAG TPA: FAD-dependent oxidoreductase [Anaeromyxobacteraceae bacterium]|nr:FAD-dependent oxidoreductase [Anaeromyxobacteraceae bacterium]